MKKINLFLGIALMSLFVMSCGSSKEVAQPQPKQPASVPCPDCIATNGGTFKYLGQSVADNEYDIQDARIFAEQAARDGLQAMVESVVERSVDNFSQKHRSDADVQTIQKSTIKAIDIIKGKIKSTPVTCWDAAPSQLTPGKISVYACVELASQSIYDEVVKAMSADKELRIDFADHQYKEEFNKALEEYDKIK